MKKFEDAGKDKNPRKWQCYVCAVQHPDYEAYKTHIIEKHEEGREYILCPTCQAPVRDMKMHYENRHPNRQMPKGLQMKATVWYDFSSSGKRKTRKPRFKEGFFRSEKMNNELHYRSGYEKEVYELLEKDQEVVSYYVEPFKIPYCHEGEWHDYVPDLRVNYRDGVVQILEIKPATQTGIAKNKAKWTAMTEQANQKGWEFSVLTEVGINKMKTKIRQQN